MNQITPQKKVIFKDNLKVDVYCILAPSIISEKHRFLKPVLW